MKPSVTAMLCVDAGDGMFRVAECRKGKGDVWYEVRRPRRQKREITPLPGRKGGKAK